MSELNAAYEKAAVFQTLEIAEAPESPEIEAKIKELFGVDAADIASSGMFPVAPGPITPDHLVYAKVFPFVAELTAENVAAYQKGRGYMPKVVIAGDRVYGIVASQKMRISRWNWRRMVRLLFSWPKLLAGLST